MNFAAARYRYFLLPRQESNLNSSDPESDVLPITPRGNGGILTTFANSQPLDSLENGFSAKIFLQFAAELHFLLFNIQKHFYFGKADTIPAQRL